MRFEEHCRRAVELTGRPHEEVHRWLDELFATMGPGHRFVRHNQKGVDHVRRVFGEEAARAARQHILDDGEYPGPERDG